jgi:hypothetical protein
MKPDTIFSASSHYFLLKDFLFKPRACAKSDPGTFTNQRMEDSETAWKFSFSMENCQVYNHCLILLCTALLFNIFVIVTFQNKSADLGTK